MSDTRRYLLEYVDEAAIVQLYADGFPALSLNDQILVWHLYQAALAGRDIYYDQRYRHSLVMRETLEQMLEHGEVLDPTVLAEIRRYTKLFWINSGPYNNLTARKFVLRLTPDQLLTAFRGAETAGARLPLQDDDDVATFASRVAPLFLDPAVDAIVTNKTPGPGDDILRASANNLYQGVTMADLDAFEERYGLNSRLVKRDDGLVEEVYRVGARYDREIRRVVMHLENAIPFASAGTAAALRALTRFYRTGEDADRVAYDVAWVRDDASTVDTINGFVEVYLDPRGTKGAWGALVYYIDAVKTHRIQTLAARAQWFEDRMPWEPRFRKAEVLGVSARAIEVVVETGDAGPVSPLGINLPNDQSVREQHGSKSVLLANVHAAYDASTPEGLRTEFSWSDEEVARAEKWSSLSDQLTTEMHEVIGHGSGRMDEAVTSLPHLLLKEQCSALEESRADLVALYFLPDPMLADLGLLRAEDQPEIVQAEYESYTRNALVQLRRVREGTQLEEDHMRNRQMIVHWLMAHTHAIEVRSREQKTYYVMVDAASFREGTGRLLAEVQRIKGDGDYAAAQRLFDTYGVHFDGRLRDEVVARVDALQLPSYTGFVMPRLEPQYEGTEIVNVDISYPCDLETQMLEYSAMSRSEESLTPPKGAMATQAG